MLNNKPKSCRVLGNLDVSLYINFLENLSFNVSNKYNRKKYFKNCLTYFLVDHSKIKSKKILNNFLHISQDLIEILQLTYGKGSSDNIQFSLLLPNSKILPHIDEGELFENSHRIHVVLKTNNKTEFIVNDESYYFSEGTVFELNNQCTHSVINHSEECERIHLIVDYIPNYPSFLKR